MYRAALSIGLGLVLALGWAGSPLYGQDRNPPPWGNLPSEVDSMPSYLRNSIMMNFLKSLASALEKGDTASLDEFFQKITKMGFYKAFGVFQASRLAANYIYLRYLDKIVKPKVLQHLMRSHFQWSVAMFISALRSGNFEPKMFLVDLSVFRISIELADRALKALTKMTKLKPLSRFIKLKNALGLSQIPGWVFTSGRVAIILYFAGNASGKIKSYLKEREERQKIRENTLKMLRTLARPDATREEQLAVVGRVLSAFDQFRQRQLEVLQKELERYQERFNQLGRKIHKLAVALEGWKRYIRENPEKGDQLAPVVEKLELQLREALEKEGEEIYEAYRRALGRQLKRIYTEGKAVPLRVDRTTLWLARGAQDYAEGDPYGRRSDSLATRGRSWLRRRFQKTFSSDLPTNPILLYRLEESLLALAQELTHSPEVRRKLQIWQKQLKQRRILEFELVRPLLEGVSEPREGVLERIRKLVK